MQMNKLHFSPRDFPKKNPEALPTILPNQAINIAHRRRCHCLAIKNQPAIKIILKPGKTAPKKGKDSRKPTQIILSN